MCWLYVYVVYIVSSTLCEKRNDPSSGWLTRKTNSNSLVQNPMAEKAQTPVSIKALGEIRAKLFRKKKKRWGCQAISNNTWLIMVVGYKPKLSLLSHPFSCSLKIEKARGVGDTRGFSLATFFAFDIFWPWFSLSSARWHHRCHLFAQKPLL